MRRLLFNFIAALSLLVCIGVGILWVRSHNSYAPEQAQLWYNHWPEQDQSYSYFVEAASYNDTLALRLDYDHMEPAHWQSMSPDERKQMRNFPPGLRTSVMARKQFPEGCYRQTGFSWFHGARSPWTGYSEHYFALTVRPWLPMLALAIPPGLWLHGFRKSWRRARVGCCAACGYDLRATPDRCPECGLVPEARVAARIAPATVAA